MFLVRMRESGWQPGPLEDYGYRSPLETELEKGSIQQHFFFNFYLYPDVYLEEEFSITLGE